MDAQPATHEPLVIRRGRHFGWWVEGRKSNGRRYLYTWLPTKGLALWTARTWAAILLRFGRTETPINVQEPSVQDG